jgi:hypothetical protein
MNDVLPASVQKLCDQAPVATPPERLRAHEARRPLHQRSGERRLPNVGAHAGGIAAEGGDAKAPELILPRLSCAATAELGRVPVSDPVSLEYGGELWLVELRVVARAGKSPHVDECADAGVTEDRYELVTRTRPMTDGPDCHGASVAAQSCAWPTASISGSYEPERAAAFRRARCANADCAALTLACSPFQAASADAWRARP